MATNTGKGKKKGNKKTIPLQVLLAEDSTAPQGFNARKIDWADACDDDFMDDKFTLNYKRTDTTTVLLPTAPKATRGPDFDLSSVPTEPPFKAYLGNLPYDVSQQEITRYFQKLNIIDVRLPLLNGRQRGFAYAQFPDRQSLIDALTMNGDMFRNRQLKVGLPGDNSTDNSSRDSNREERQDRTAGDWRTGPRAEEPPRDTNRDQSYQSYNYRNGSNDSMQRRGNEMGGYGNRNRSDGDRTFRPSNDRSNNYSNDRGYDRGYERPSDRNYDRGFERSNNRGFEETRDYESNDRSAYRPPNQRNFSERRPENRREFGGNFERRGRDDTYESRNTDQSPTREDDEKPRERQKLQLKPRSKPIEATGETVVPVNSAIFGGAKPVNTAAREQEIEQKLLKEKEEVEKKDERIRRISSGSNVSGNSRSRKDSERDVDDNYRSNGSQRSAGRQRKTSERSDRSGGQNDSAPKYIMTRNKDLPRDQPSRYVPVRGDRDSRDSRDQRSYNRETRGGPQRFTNNNNNNNNRSNNRPKERERDQRFDSYNRPPRMSHPSDEEEDKKIAYTTSNKFAHLTNETNEDYDEEEALRNANASD